MSLPDQRSEARWLSSLLAALVVGLLNTVLTISLAALVFSGDLDTFLAEGIGLALVSAIIVGAVVALTSSMRGMIGSVQDAASAVLAIAAAGAVTVLPASATPNEVLVTIVVANGLTALIVGAFLLVTGVFGLGRLVRFLPFPVIGGFLAGMGWLVLLGAVTVMAGVPVTWSTLSALVTGDALLRWLPGIAYALVLLIVSERVPHVATWPALLLTPVAGFYALMAALGGSIEGWRAAGLLPGAFPEGDLFTIVDYGQLGAVHWPAVYTYLPSIVALCVLTAISVLFNTTALELMTNDDVDLDTELRSAGLSNLAIGAIGGQVGYQMLGDSIVLRRIGRGTRVEALGSVLVVALGLAFGARFIPLLPSFVIGGFLAYIGLMFLRDWLVDTFRTLATVEYAIVVVILVVIGTVGFLEGIGVGIVATVVLFVVDYGRADVVKHERTGRSARSRVTRSRAAQDALDARSGATYVLELQGFVFFGTANALIDRVRARLAEQLETRFVVLDFQRVTGLDATARLAFEKLARIAGRHDVELVLSHASRDVLNKLEEVRTAREFRHIVRSEPTLDAALEGCEEALLEGFDDGVVQQELSAFLTAELDDADAVTQILDAFETVQFAEGEALIRQGDPPRGLFFIAEGKITAQLERDDQPPLRLETMGPGSFVGELGFYTGAVRSASVVADGPTRAHRLNRASLAALTDEAPEAAAAFHALMVRVLAKRTSHLMQVVQSLHG